MAYGSTDKPTLSQIFSTVSSRLVLAFALVSSPLFAADKGQDDSYAKSFQAGKKSAPMLTGGGTSRPPTTRTLRTEEGLGSGECSDLASGNAGQSGASTTEQRTLRASDERAIEIMGCTNTFTEAYHLDPNQSRMFKEQWGLSPDEVTGSFVEGSNGPRFVFDSGLEVDIKSLSRTVILKSLKSHGEKNSYKMDNEAWQLFSKFFVVIGVEGHTSPVQDCLMISGYFMHKGKLASGQKQENLFAFARMYMEYFLEHAYREG